MSDRGACSRSRNEKGAAIDVKHALCLGGWVFVGRFAAAIQWFGLPKQFTGWVC